MSRGRPVPPWTTRREGWYASELCLESNRRPAHTRTFRPGAEGDPDDPGGASVCVESGAGAGGLGRSGVHSLAAAVQGRRDARRRARPGRRNMVPRLDLRRRAGRHTGRARRRPHRGLRRPVWRRGGRRTGPPGRLRGGRTRRWGRRPTRRRHLPHRQQGAGHSQRRRHPRRRARQDEARPPLSGPRTPHHGRCHHVRRRRHAAPHGGGRRPPSPGLRRQSRRHGTASCRRLGPGGRRLGHARGGQHRPLEGTHPEPLPPQPPHGHASGRGRPTGTR